LFNITFGILFCHTTVVPIRAKLYTVLKCRITQNSMVYISLRQGSYIRSAKTKMGS
jgi:hypothetical protein